VLGVTFLTPAAGLVGLAGALPLGAWLLGRRRGARAARALGLAAAVDRDWIAPVALVAISALVGLAAAQPVHARSVSREVRTDAQALYVLDTSESMLAARGPNATDRLDQARRVALAMRRELPDIPSGVASLTDRLLPDLLPTADESAFVSTVTDAVQVNEPPPRDENALATTFDALAEVRSGYFAPAIHRRVLVVVTDGESRAFDAAGVARTLAQRPATTVVAIRVGGAGDRIWRNGKADPGYAPEAGAGRELAALAGAGGTLAPDAAAGARAVRAALGTGRTARQGMTSGRTALAPYLLALALVPLAGLLLVRNFS
jgi:hypothetical protein